MMHEENRIACWNVLGGETLKIFLKELTFDCIMPLLMPAMGIQEGTTSMSINNVLCYIFVNCQKIIVKDMGQIVIGISDESTG